MNWKKKLDAVSPCFMPNNHTSWFSHIYRKNSWREKEQAFGWCSRWAKQKEIQTLNLHIFMESLTLICKRWNSCSMCHVIFSWLLFFLVEGLWGYSFLCVVIHFFVDDDSITLKSCQVHCFVDSKWGATIAGLSVVVACETTTCIY